MSTLPFISVIMPAYNCGKYVKQAIDSVLNQDYKHFELLIADDCSTDDTKSLIDSYNNNNIKKFHNTSNQGYLKASNLLLKQAKGDYIIFQDADDFAAPQRFSVLADYLEKNKEVYAVGSNSVTVDEKGNELSVSDFPLAHNEILEHFSKYRTVIVGSALMFRKEILNTIGYYNEYFNRIGWEDFYWFSLIILKYKVANVKDKLYYYRKNMNSVSNQNRSFRSVAGFNVIVYYMKERLAGRPDPIALGNWEEVDKMMGRFYISECLREGTPTNFKKLKEISGNFFSAIQLYLFQKKLQLKSGN